LLVDSHCHFIENDISVYTELLSSVHKLIIGSYSPEDWQKQLSIKQKFPQQIFTSLGYHPWYLTESTRADSKHLEENIKNFDFIGETGLDAHGKWNSSLKLQIISFEKHIDLATEHKKPLIIHCVKAEKDILRILKKYNKPYKGMIHSFQGTIKDAEQFVELGFYISFGPSIIREPSKKLIEVLHNISLDHVLLESDSHESSEISRILLEVAKVIAYYQKTTSDKVIETNFKNFNLLTGVNHGMDADSDQSHTT
jgi:TatD DNase family protein